MKRLKYIAWFVLILALAVSVITTYTLVQQQNALRNSLKDIITTQIKSIPEPKDGVDGKNVTPEQINQAVNTYLTNNPVKSGADGKNGTNGINGQNTTDDQVQNAVNTYMDKHPVTNGKDGQDGQSGLTPQIRCDADKNRWEVRYSDTESWQALNGQVIKCTINS